MRCTLILSACVLSLPFLLTACGPEPPEVARGEPDGAAFAERTAPSVGVTAAAIPVLNTYHSEWLQIDADASAPPGDANLYTGNDPADGTASFDLPAGGDAYFDWDDLGDEVDDHRYLDLENERGRDPTAFPRSNSCVGAAHVLSKMDLTYVAVVNNTDQAYFAVQRSGNNGDAGYYWLVTREPPRLVADSGRCRPGEYELQFDLKGPDAAAGTTGDMLLRGHFMGSDVPMMIVYKALADATGTVAVNAVNFENTALWHEHEEESLAAVNETTTRAGSFGAAGVDASDGVDLEPEVFAEAAVAVSLLQGPDVCGGTFYGTVITRSSGAGGTSPDLKDVAGPFALNFQPVEAEAALTPLCDGMVHYEATIADEDLEVTCDWVFDDGTVVTNSCAGDVAVTPGTRSATLTASAVGTVCSDEVATASVEVGGTLGASVSTEASCDDAFAYDSEVTGASGVVSYAWTFTDAAGTVVATSTTAAGYADVGGAGAFHADLVVTDDRGDGLVCTAEADADEEVLAALDVDATLTGSCDETLGYTSSVTGGDGDPTYAWTFSDGWTSSAASGNRALGDQPRGGTEYSADLVVTYVAEDGMTCQGSDTDSAMVYSPLDVHLTPDSLGGECPTTDAVTYTASITGGGSGVTLDWTIDACDGAASCTVNPPDSDTCETATIQLTVRDPGVCDDRASEVESYTKYTVVTASNN